MTDNTISAISDKKSIHRFQKKFIPIIPEYGSTPLEQFNECLNSITELLHSSDLPPENIIKQSIFVKADNNQDFYRKKKEFESILKDFYTGSCPPTCIIGQPPENHFFVTFELLVLSRPSDQITIEHKNIDGISYVVVSNHQFKEVSSAGLTIGREDAGIEEQARFSFESIKKILDKEKLEFSDIVRQWNYIEDIVIVESREGTERQNYQIFNDIRSIFYGTADFKSLGYPSATGIGMNTGGIIIDFIAMKKSPAVSIVPLKNPRQVDAHRYSQNQLVGDALQEVSRKTTPKFERGKTVSIGNYHMVYISGTAAILGEETIPEDSVEKQTVITIQNIQELVSIKNLKDHGVTGTLSPRPLSYLRVYVKNKTEIPSVRQICEEYFPGVPSLYLVADVCRANLLVELEGIVEYDG